MKLSLIIFWLLVILFIASAISRASPQCMTLAEARATHPKDHLYSQRGCWGTQKAPTIRKPKPVAPALIEPEQDPEPVETLQIASTDANGTIATDAFNGPHQRFALFAIDTSPPIRKVDRLPVPLPELHPDTLEPPVIEHSKVRVTAWIMLFAGVVLLAFVLAVIISRLSGMLPPHGRFLTGGRRRSNVTTGIAVARSDLKSQASRQHATVGSDGERDQQSHFHSRSVRERERGVERGGYADHSVAAAYRRDDLTAIGAWARARGLRPAPASGAANAEPVTAAVEPVSLGWLGKRIARFAR
jgi:hypothetical protein